MQTNRIFFEFLKAIGFKMNKVPFRKCKAGYKTFKDSRLGIFVFNTEKSEIVQILDKTFFNGQEYEKKKVINTFKIQFQEDKIKFLQVA